MDSPGPTRRELIAGAVAGSAAASLGASGATALAATGSGSGPAALAYALQAERLGVIAYRQALSTSVLSTHVSQQLQVLMGQERAHVSKLERVLGEVGAPIPRGPDTVAAAQAMLAQHQVDVSLSDLPSEHACLRLLIDVESLTEGAYFKAIPQLDQPSLLRVSVEIMGSDSQHWTILSGLQHRGDVGLSVPYPFVQGSP